jgi:hypothetical protein
MPVDFPEGSVPEDRTDRPSMIASTGLNALLLNGAFAHFIRHHFSDFRNIEDPRLRDRIQRNPFKPGDTTGLFIDDLDEWAPEKTNQRPAILCKRGKYEFQRFIFNDEVDDDVLTGSSDHEVMCVGSTGIICMSPLPAEATILAIELYRYFVRFNQVIQQELGLHRFLVGAVESVSTVEEATEQFAVPISLGYVFTEQWRVSPMTPKLKDVDFDPQVS